MIPRELACGKAANNTFAISSGLASALKKEKLTLRARLSETRVNNSSIAFSAAERAVRMQMDRQMIYIVRRKPSWRGTWSTSRVEFQKLGRLTENTELFHMPADKVTVCKLLQFFKQSAATKDV